MPAKTLITAALPYANGPLHFGHIAGAYLPADAYARFCRLCKEEVLFVCGSDEYGVAITLSAEQAGRTPQAHVDIFHQVIEQFFASLNISFDVYGRTSAQRHQAPVQQFFLDLLHNGYIEERVTDQLYSVEDQRFLADRYVVGGCPRCGFDQARGDECPSCGASYEATDLIAPRSKLTGASLERRATNHWFLLLDKFKEPLTQWLATKKWKPNVVNFVKGYIEDLHPRAITRDASWGVPVPLPNTEGKVLYVWFDAPIGYLSIAMEWAQAKGDPELWKKFWCDPETKLVQFLGKDNIPFHAVIFPAMIMGQNVPLKTVDELPANEFYLLEGRQFSKSDHWLIDLERFFTHYHADQIRYMIAATAPETADAAFTWKEFQLRCNGDLVGKWGNFAHRVLVFAKNHCASTIPYQNQIEPHLTPIDKAFISQIELLITQAHEAYSHYRLRRASQTIMELAQAGNVYFDAKKPWQAAKDAAQRPSLEVTIWCCLQALKGLVLIAQPILPSAADLLWHLLGQKEPLVHFSWEQMEQLTLAGGTLLPEPKVLFSRVDEKQIAEEEQKLKG